MSDKRFLGNIITPTPAEPAGPFQDGAAPGVWSLQEAFAYIKVGRWPTAGVIQRGVFAGGRASDLSSDVIDFIAIPSAGNATDFGNLTQARYVLAGCASSTRGVFGGGVTVGSSYVNTLDYVTILTEGNAVDFGDLSLASSDIAACSSETRGLFAGGDFFSETDFATNIITFITISSEGNAADFGDLTQPRDSLAGCSSPTRGLFATGVTTGSVRVNTIDFVTIASAANATDFGDVTQLRTGVGGCSSATRGVFAGGFNAGVFFNTIDFVTIASAGNATDFGDLSVARSGAAGCSSATRGVFGGGRVGSGNGFNTIDFVTIASAGNATDFGDLSVTRSQSAPFGACSNAHGGLS